MKPRYRLLLSRMLVKQWFLLPLNFEAEEYIKSTTGFRYYANYTKFI